MLKPFGKAKRIIGAAKRTLHAGPFRVSVGACPVCEAMSLRRAAVFVVEGPSLRESTMCVRCQSNARNRAVLHCLGAVLPAWRELAVFEAGAGSALSTALSAACPNHIPSQYLPTVERGRWENGMRSEDLQQLSLEDASVDAVVTEDVFEHVHDPSRAFAEVARVLRPGGVHVFTVPFHSAPTTITRAVIGAGGEIEHVLPAEYHGDPLSSNGVLVVSDFGQDLPDLIERASGLRTIVLAITDPWRGILEPCTVFVSH